MNENEQRIAAWELGIRDRDPEIRQTVIRQIRDCGATAQGLAGVPMLLEALKSPDVDTHQSALLALAEVAPDSDAALDGVVRIWREGYPIECWALAELAKSAGPNATRLVPLMLSTLANANRSDSGFNHCLHEMLIGSIGALGPAVPPEVLPLLNDAVYGRHTDERVNYAAINALSRMGAAGIACLLRAATDEESPSYVREYVIETLGELPDEAGRVVPILLQLTRASEWSYLANLAASALGQLGPAARQAGGTLLRILNDEDADKELRATAAHALWRITGNATFVLPAMLKLLATRPTSNTLFFLVQTCAAIGPPAAETVPWLREFVHDAALRDYYRTLAAVALWRITGFYEGQLTELERHVSENTFCRMPDVHAWAEQAITQVRGYEKRN